MPDDANDPRPPTPKHLLDLTAFACRFIATRTIAGWSRRGAIPRAVARIERPRSRCENPGQLCRISLRSTRATDSPDFLDSRAGRQVAGGRAATALPGNAAQNVRRRHLGVGRNDAGATIPTCWNSSLPYRIEA